MIKFTERDRLMKYTQKIDYKTYPDNLSEKWILIPISQSGKKIKFGMEKVMLSRT